MTVLVAALVLVDIGLSVDNAVAVSVAVLTFFSTAGLVGRGGLVNIARAKQAIQKKKISTTVPSNPIIIHCVLVTVFSNVINYRRAAPLELERHVCKRYSAPTAPEVTREMKTTSNRANQVR